MNNKNKKITFVFCSRWCSRLAFCNLDISFCMVCSFFSYRLRTSSDFSFATASTLPMFFNTLSLCATKEEIILLYDKRNGSFPEKKTVALSWGNKLEFKGIPLGYTKKLRKNTVNLQGGGDLNSVGFNSIHIIRLPISTS